MKTFRQYCEYMVSSQTGAVDPAKIKQITTHIDKAVLPNMSPQEKAKFQLIFNPASPVLQDFWSKVQQSGYNVGKVVNIARELENDPRLPKINQYVSQQNNQKNVQTTPTI